MLPPLSDCVSDEAWLSACAAPGGKRTRERFSPFDFIVSVPIAFPPGLLRFCTFIRLIEGGAGKTRCPMKACEFRNHLHQPVCNPPREQQVFCQQYQKCEIQIILKLHATHPSLPFPRHIENFKLPAGETSERFTLFTTVPRETAAPTM
jgi:hypothetical protein